jgi:hypothetical protein
MMGREVDLWAFHPGQSGDGLPQGESSRVVSLVEEMPTVRMLEIRHTADIPGPEPVAFHIIQSLRRGAES